MSDPIHILLVEDDKDLSEITRVNLARSGYAVDCAFSLKNAYDLLETNSYALILLDVMLPDGEGFELCRDIREKRRCPIIFISCIDDGDSIVNALQLGGDDYMTKPLDYRELLARISANIRRATVYSDAETSYFDESIVHLRNFSIDRRHKCARRDGISISLTHTEYAILEYFHSHTGDLILYSDLYSRIWGGDAMDDLRTLIVHVSNLRKKIDPERRGIIETVRNAGYIFSNV